MGSLSQLQLAFAEAPSLWGFWEGWRGSATTVDNSCGTDPAVEFHQDSNLRQERKCIYSGQLLRTASTLRYHGATILRRATILNSCSGKFFCGSHRLGQEGRACHCFEEDFAKWILVTTMNICFPVSTITVSHYSPTAREKMVSPHPIWELEPQERSMLWREKAIKCSEYCDSQRFLQEMVW